MQVYEASNPKKNDTGIGGIKPLAIALRLKLKK